MKNYFGEFTNKAGTHYRVDFYVTTGSGTEELMLGENPFVTDMSTDNEIIYSPIKASGATVQLLLDEAKFDLYTEDPTGIKVTLTNEITNEIEWSGYVTPCVYDMPYDSHFEYIEIECVDYLSVLQNIKYEAVNNKRELRTWSYILNQLLQKTGLKNLYITNAVQLTGKNANDSVIEKIMINEDLFFDPQDSPLQTVYDLAWNGYDILHEMLQYLGYTAFCQGESIYIIDYDAIINGNNSYFKYNIGGTGELTGRSNATLPYNFAIKYDVVCGNTNLNMSAVYNKVSVKDEFKDMDSMLGDTTYQTENITKTTGSATGAIQFFDAFQDEDVNGVNVNKQFAVWYAKPDSGVTRYYVTSYKFLRHENIQTYYYDSTATYNVVSKTINGNIGIQDLLGFTLGCTYCDIAKVKIDENTFNQWKSKYSNYNSLSKKEKLSAWSNLFNGKVTYSRYFLMRNYDAIDHKIGPAGILTTKSFNRTENEDCRKYPYFKYSGSLNDSVMVGGQDVFLRIKGQIFHRQGCMIMTPMSGSGDGADKTDMNGDFKFMNDCYHWARLKVGNQYWSGSGWQSSACDFKLWILKPDGSHNSTKKFLRPDGGIKVYKYWDQSFDFINPNATFIETDEAGYYIPAPEDGVLNGNLEFTFYCPRDFYGRSRHDGWGGDKWKINGTKYKHDYYSRYYNSVTCLKDFDIDVYVTNGIADDQGKDSDTIYFNSLENASVEELDEINFKICTFDNKNASFSIPVWNDGTTNKPFVEELYHRNLSDKMLSDNGSLTLIAEKMLIYRIVNQCEKPRVEYDYNIRGCNHKLYGIFTDSVIQNKKFIADSISIDYKTDSANVKLVEKV